MRKWAIPVTVALGFLVHTKKAEDRRLGWT